jgi:hypothetical protein
MIPYSFHNRGSARVAYREALTRYTPEITFTPGSPVEHGVTDENVIMRFDAAFPGWIDNELTPR